jgi:hypothetical protein
MKKPKTSVYELCFKLGRLSCNSIDQKKISESLRFQISSRYVEYFRRNEGKIKKHISHIDVFDFSSFS